MVDGALAGVRVGVTGARKGPELCAAIERRGGTALHGPTIEPDQPTPDDELLPQLRELLGSDADWFVANTGMGVRLLFACAERHDLDESLLAWLGNRRVVARGAKAVGGLRGIGVTPEAVSDAETDASMAAWLRDHVAAGDHLAVQYSARTRGDYENLVAALDATMKVVRPYRTGVPTDDTAARTLVERAVARDLDVVISTSAIATDHLAVIAERHGLLDELQTAFTDGVVAAAIGQVTADAFREHGIEPGLIPPRHRTGSLLTALEDWAATRRPARSGDPATGGRIS